MYSFIRELRVAETIIIWSKQFTWISFHFLAQNGAGDDPYISFWVPPSPSLCGMAEPVMDISGLGTKAGYTAARMGMSKYLKLCL